MKILIAGAGGILGRALVRRNLDRGNTVTALVLRRAELSGDLAERITVVEADVRRPEQLQGLCAGMERVISCIGITRIRGALTHDAVDYQGNVNLLREAKRAGVSGFGFISPAGTGDDASHVPLLDAKNRFEQELRRSGVPWIIFHSGGFFPDLAEMKVMASKGPLFVIGDGSSRSTPIDVEDLADIMVREMDASLCRCVEVGGPEHLSWMDICHACFESVGRRPSVLRIPVRLCEMTLAVIRPFSFRHYAMGRLLVFMSTRDVCTMAMGKRTIKDYLRQSLPA
ncbi:MAG: hypothetical protein A2498_04815 [Lentisphaerae bacterium RIFOXYC12_FULL_60_16]|nr:MAG: hypothetical protein A2498_04815 [Lentisphaerae bacterium RIFOXYC12_FULL_60_16]OGV77716.1 MAG: hypothetical protein A2340_11050 [Lentisphaerae bacterium RIFOXYB12_FULL_60_10]